LELGEFGVSGLRGLLRARLVEHDLLHRAANNVACRLCHINAGRR
jgi:cytochrome c